MRRPIVLALALVLAPLAEAADGPALAAAEGAAVAAGAGGSTRVAAGGTASALGLTTRGTAPTRGARPDGAGLWMADRVYVDKSERKLHLLNEGQVMRTYDISLGKNPVGDKREEGDLRTPEGDYVLDWRNPTSDFFMSMHISYPNSQDRQEARRRGVNPGSMIMIHGLPNDAEATRSDYLYEDWTDGCIAVSNQAMIDIWLSVPDNTPITIVP